MTGASIRRSARQVGGRGLRPDAKMAYLIRDEFNVARAAGAVDGTAAEPGPGTRSIVDDDGDSLTISSGVLRYANPNAAWSNGLWYDEGITRTAGRFAKLCLNDLAGAAAKDMNFGFDASIDDGTLGNDQIYFNGTTIYGRNPSLVAVGSWAASTPYEVVVVLRTNGSYVFIKGGSYTVWTLLWWHASTSDATLYAGQASYNGTYDCSCVRVPEDTWLPRPIAYDTFTRSNGALGVSETAGPDSQACDSRTWVFDSGIWTVASNVAVGTPAAGGELWDAAAATFAAGTYSWAVYGTNTIANDANSLKVTWVDNESGAYNYFRDASDLSSDLTVGTWYLFQCDAKVEATESVDVIAREQQVSVTDTTFTTHSMVFRATAAASNILKLGAMDTDNDIIWLDNLSLKPLTLSELITSVDDSSTSDVHVSVKATIAAAHGTPAGVTLNLDDAATPANFVVAYHDGVYAILDKCVAGTWTNVIKAVTTYSAGATVHVVKTGTSYTLYYNNAKVGATSTISDAGIIDNTKHGMFSTDASNSLNDFLVFPIGKDNEYSKLGRY